MDQPTYVKTWKYTKWLVGSSIGFMAPSLYAYYNGAYFLGVVLTITSAVSANFWRYAIDSLRRNMDLVVAKIAFVIFMYYGIVHIRNLYCIVTAYTSLPIMGYCYYLSGKLSTENNTHWVVYHFVFHCLLIYNQYIIIHNVLRS
jgi:hypothetical protein